jgi:hypothetical protein
MTLAGNCEACGYYTWTLYIRGEYQLCWDCAEKYDEKEDGDGKRSERP